MLRRKAYGMLMVQCRETLLEFETTVRINSVAQTIMVRITPTVMAGVFDGYAVSRKAAIPAATSVDRLDNGLGRKPPSIHTKSLRMNRTDVFNFCFTRSSLMCS